MAKYPFDVHKVWIIRDDILSRMGQDGDTIAELAPHRTVEELIEAGLVFEGGAHIECVPNIVREE